MDFPIVPGAYDTTFNGGTSNDLYVAKLNSSGSSLLYSTYIGGSGRESCWGFKMDTASNIYLTGGTGSTDFHTTLGAYDSTYNGGNVMTDPEIGDMYLIRVCV